ncbi:hypothetical protein HGRIS_007500 [Hohenbuehelia grisea]|uniref:Carbonic anhydrase n=1 Tax=Hohenbuehelia grisea TaxID=104357 RepID=A0ABR3J523_9AGAR
MTFCHLRLVQASQKKPAVALPPTKRLAIVTCMDARINPFTQLGIKDGEAHIIRNAGAVAKDALRSLIISQRLLGTREIAIYHHTGCGIVTFTSPELRQKIKDADPENEATAEAVEQVDFLTYPPDLEQSVRNDVKFLQENPLILKGTKVTGWIWDVDSRQATRVI